MTDHQHLFDPSEVFVYVDGKPYYRCTRADCEVMFLTPGVPGHTHSYEDAYHDLREEPIVVRVCDEFDPADFSTLNPKDSKMTKTANEVTAADALGVLAGVIFILAATLAAIAYVTSGRSQDVLIVLTVFTAATATALGFGSTALAARERADR